MTANMDRSDVIACRRAVEPALKARGIEGLFLFGSYRRDEADANSDIDVFVDRGCDAFYDLSNFMGAYADLQGAFPGVAIRLFDARRSFGACAAGG